MGKNTKIIIISNCCCFFRMLLRMPHDWQVIMLLNDRNSLSYSIYSGRICRFCWSPVHHYRFSSGENLSLWLPSKVFRVMFLRRDNPAI